MQEIIDRFISYAKIDTQADPESSSTPSSQKQFDLAKILYKELKEMGIEDLELTDECYIYATIPSNISDKKIPKIGFVAHIDTTPDAPATGVKPQVLKNYNGGDIKISDTAGENGEPLFIKFEDNPALKNCIGHTLITSDGTTLLSSDDKSGVTAIMEIAKFFTENPDVPHGPIGIAFTPDEEIGRGTEKFDIEKFGCEYAYTIDGEMPPYINKETFSADHAWVRIKGRDIHPGSAKDIMVNSARILSEIIAKLPKDMAPETTDGHQPYIHPHSISGNVKNSEVMLLFRAFDNETLKEQKDIVQEIINEVGGKYPKAKIELEVKEIYRNMLDVLSANPKGCDYLEEAVRYSGLDPIWEPIRGGTDGSKLSELGLPCPNIFTGGQNFHSVQEWLSVDSLLKTIETMKNLVKIWAEKG